MLNYISIICLVLKSFSCSSSEATNQLKAGMKRSWLCLLSSIAYLAPCLQPAAKADKNRIKWAQHVKKKLKHYSKKTLTDSENVEYLLNKKKYRANY